MDWYTNPWVIGILGSIPSGFVVNWASGYLLGRRENREYLQKVIGANREIVYAIRPGISEGQIPSAEVLTSLVNATARRYSVEASDLYSPTQISEELVKEVMDSSFISSVQKKEYCGRLAELGNAMKQEEPDAAKEATPKTIVEYRQRFVSTISMLMGVLTATVTLMYTFLEFIRKKDAIVSDGKQFDSFIPLIIAMVSMISVTLVMVLYRDFIRRKDRDDPAESVTMRISKKSPSSAKSKPPE